MLSGLFDSIYFRLTFSLDSCSSQYRPSFWAGRSHFEPLLVLKTHLRYTFLGPLSFLVRKYGKSFGRSGKQTEQGRSPRSKAWRSSTLI